MYVIAVHSQSNQTVCTCCSTSTAVNIDRYLVPTKKYVQNIRHLKKKETAASSVSWVFVSGGLWLFLLAFPLASLFLFSLPPFLPLPLSLFSLETKSKCGTTVVYGYRNRYSYCCTTLLLLYVPPKYWFKGGIHGRVVSCALCYVMRAGPEKIGRIRILQQNPLCSVFLPIFVVLVS